MTFVSEAELVECSGVLAEGLRGVAEDVRSIDLIDLISYIRFGSYATLEDLLQSSTELLFESGALTFAWTAAVDMPWGELPTVTLGMEFRYGAVWVYFDLCLSAADESARICGMLLDDAVGDSRGSVTRLREALAGARLPGSLDGAQGSLRARRGA